MRRWAIIEIRQLEYFMMVCDLMHVTKAAEKLGIAQPTLSLQIRALEEELGVPLFDRIGKKIVLTEAGELLRDHGAKIVRDMRNAKDSINELRSYQRGTVTAGALPSDLDYRISKLLIDYHTEYPKIKLKVISSIEITNLVLANEVDIGIGLLPLPDDRLIQIPLSREEYVLVVSEKHPLADRAAIDFQELRHIDTVMFPEGYIGRELVDDCCRPHGFTLRTIMETSTATSLLQLVKSNIGATVQPLPLIQSMDDPGLRCIKINGGAPYRNMGILYHSDRFLGHATQAFIRMAIAHFGGK